MIDYSKGQISRLIAHKAGNKTNGESLQLSTSCIDAADDDWHTSLFQYFVKSFDSAELYNFTSSTADCTLNPIFTAVTHMFDSDKQYIKHTHNIAKHLYDSCRHPQIKGGVVFIAKFSSLVLHDEIVDAIGIFKAESQSSFAIVNEGQAHIDLTLLKGLSLDKPDKGCLIFNTDKENGYRVCIIDKINKSEEAQYWRETFLQLKPCNDDFHQTRNVMDIAHKYVTAHIDEDFEIAKAEKIELLHRTKAYFKTNETFNKKQFEQDVFVDTDMIKSFRKFDKKYRDDNDVGIAEDFEISKPAVKQQSKNFRSVLKLDKNFHVYIHGNKEWIEKGQEPDGRKYYKLYYTKED